MLRSAAARIVAVAVLMFAGIPLAQAKIHVVASFSILGDMVHEVGGDTIDLTVIVGPDSDTHVYEPKPSDVQNVSKADVMVVNGLGFEGWQTRLLSASSFQGVVVVASQGIATENMEGDPSEIDPHGWQNVSFARQYAANIASGLCKADPANCETYKTRAANYDAQLAALDRDIIAVLTAVPAERRVLITSHDAFGYLGRAYGIRVLAPEGINTESEASARDVARLIDQIRTLGVTTLFVENISDPRLIEQVAAETGVKIGDALYSDALSGSDGPASTYLAMMRHNVELLVQAMSQAPAQ